MSTGKVVLGTLAGIAIGAIAGILFAPAKGSTTRKQIMDKGGDYADDFKAKFNKLFDNLEDKYESTRRDAANMASKGKEKLDEAKHEFKNASANFKQTDAADKQPVL